MKVYSGEAVAKAEFPRQCSHCAHEWIGRRNLMGVSGPEHSSRSDAVQSAQAELQERMEAFNRGGEVLCPKCGHFSILAMQTHFPNGFGPALIQRYKEVCREQINYLPGLLATIGALIGAFFILKGGGSIIVKLIGVLLALFGLGMSFYFLHYGVKGIRGLRAMPSVKEAIRNASDDQLLGLAQAAYKINGDTWQKFIHDTDADKWLKVVKDFILGG